MLRRQRASRRPVEAEACARSTRRVLIISASMGAGHDGAARELARRLESAGHQAEVRDFLDSGPLNIGSALRGGYKFELRHAPSAYDATYQFWYKAPWLAPVLSWFISLLTRRRILGWVKGGHADVVVSTYPLATLCLGRLRATGRLRIPAVNFITDFGVHPLWVHKGIDLNLTVHPDPAQLARIRSGGRTVACGPMVSERFDPANADRAGRAAARARLGLEDSDLAVLIVAGSWGVGALKETFEAVTATEGVVPVVVCGQDDSLMRQLNDVAGRHASRSVIVGWTKEMPELMTAADALVENAGGLTAFEAMRIGLPVVSYRPIAGHGKENTSAMALAGVSRLAADDAALASALGEICRPGPARESQVSAGRAMFVGDAATSVIERSAIAVPAMARAPRVRLVLTRVATGVIATAALTWGGLTTGVGVAAANGTGVAHPRQDAGAVAFVGVRLTEAELQSGEVTATIRSMGATAVLDGAVASAAPASCRELVSAGVDIANGGRGRSFDPSGHLIRPALWSRAQGDVAAATALREITGRTVTVFAPGRRVNAFDVVDSGRAHDRLVVPTAMIEVDDAAAEPAALGPRSIVLVNGLDGTPAQTSAALQRLVSALSERGLAVAPLAELR